MKMNDLAAIREEYTLRTLEKRDLSADPILQFKLWMEEALHAEVKEPTACTMISLGQDGYPDGRLVLLKDIRKDGFVFFTNYHSRKGKDIEAYPKGALNFFWIELQRQVRIVGDIEKVDSKESEAYFDSRPKGSQIGAMASDQSQPIESREELEARVDKIENRGFIKRPEHWGGYIVKPVRMEFWQGRASRLHDRFEYQMENGAFLIKRLQP